VNEVTFQLPTAADFAAFLAHPNLARLRVVEDVPVAVAQKVVGWDIIDRGQLCNLRR